MHVISAQSYTALYGLMTCGNSIPDHTRHGKRLTTNTHGTISTEDESGRDGSAGRECALRTQCDTWATGLAHARTIRHSQLSHRHTVTVTSRHTLR
jgi:hypothetical protein